MLLVLSTTETHSQVICFSSLGSPAVLKRTISGKAKMECCRSRKRKVYGAGRETREPEEREILSHLTRNMGTWERNCSKMCYGLSKELATPTFGLGKSLPNAHLAFGSYLPTAKDNLHENNQTLSSLESVGSYCLLAPAHASAAVWSQAPALGMVRKWQVVKPGFRSVGRRHFHLESLRKIPGNVSTGWLE